MSTIRCLAFVLIIGTLAGACSGGDDASPADATPRPTAVPEQATPVSQETTVGSVDDAGDKHVFISNRCSDDVMVIETDKETVYAGLSCDSALPESVTSEFEGVAISLHVVPGPPQKLFLALESGQTAEFTTDGVWIVPEE